MYVIMSAYSTCMPLLTLYSGNLKIHMKLKCICIIHVHVIYKLKVNFGTVIRWQLEFQPCTRMHVCCTLTHDQVWFAY